MGRYIISFLAILAVIVFVVLLWFYHNTIHKISIKGDDNITYRVLAAKKTRNEAVSILKQLNRDTLELMKKISKKYYNTNNSSIREVIDLITSNYNPDLLVENDPIYTIGDKTYTINQKKIAICLRLKDGSFYDYNTLLFAFLHEISHVGTHRRFIDPFAPDPNHIDMFWSVFKFLLTEAVEFKYITPINYTSDNFIDYCGVKIQHNPLFDDTIKPL